MEFAIKSIFTSPIAIYQEKQARKVRALEYNRLMEEIRTVSLNMRELQGCYDEVSDGKMLDYFTYKLRAEQCLYEFLLEEVKKVENF